MSRPTFLSLFSGIGGLDLGLERAGWECVGQVEIDPYCQRVLAKHWPDVPRWGDIKELDPDDLPRADLVAGGFPCQPVSLAGRRRGQDDARWLWPEFARVVRGLRPRWVLLENVPGLLVRGMGDVLGDLAEIGYDAEWDCIPAAAVGALHLRYRVFVVAYPAGTGHGPFAGGVSSDAVRGDGPEVRHQLGGGGAHVAHANGGRRRAGQSGLPGQPQPDLVGRGQDVANPERLSGQLRTAEGERPRRPASGGHDLGSYWATEPDVGRVAHGVPARLDRLRALGNAVVPQVAELIGRRILEATV